MKSNEEVLEELKKLYPQKEYYVTVCNACDIIATAYKSTPKLCREFARRIAFRWHNYEQWRVTFTVRVFHVIDGRHKFMYPLTIEMH